MVFISILSSLLFALFNAMSIWLVGSLITSIMMPNKDGIQFLNHFRTLDFNTPVLMLTADNQIEKKSKNK